MSGQKKIIYALVIASILFLVAKAIFPSAEGNKKYEEKQFWLKKTFGEEKADVVIGGDSRVYRGVSTNSLSKGLGGNLTSLNLGYSSAGYSNEYFDFLLSRMKKKETPILILGITPHSLTKEAAKNEDYNQYKKMTAFQRFEGLYLSELKKVFTLHNPKEIVEILFVKRSQREGYFQDFTEGGWVGSYEIPNDSTSAIESYKKTFGKYQVSESVTEAFLKRVEKIRKSGVQVIAFRLPTTDQMEQLEDSISGFNEDYIKEQLESYGCVWLEFQNKGYRSYDGSHLHFKSAEKLSEELGNRVMKILSGTK